MKEEIIKLCQTVYGKSCPELCPLEKEQCDGCSICTDPQNLEFLLSEEELPQKWQEFIKNCIT
jgi:hypothetical protein